MRASAKKLEDEEANSGEAEKGGVDGILCIFHIKAQCADASFTPFRFLFVILIPNLVEPSWQNEANSSVGEFPIF